MLVSVDCCRGAELLGLQRKLYFVAFWIFVKAVLCVPSITASDNHTNYTGNPASSIALSENPYVIENRYVCRNLSNMLAIIVIHSATSHFGRRAAIRDTWTNQAWFPDHVIRRVFLLGRPINKTEQFLINHEHGVNGDIVQGDFVDSYHNLTHKAVLELRWITSYCSNAKYLVRADDDVIINTFRLLSLLTTSYSGKKRHIWCQVRPKGRTLIYREGKWEVPYHMFQNMSRYPFTDCMGFAAVITRDIIPELSEATKVTPYFWIDDVFLFGMLAERIGHVFHKPIERISLSEQFSKVCFQRSKPCSIFVGKAESPGVMDEIWLQMLKIKGQLVSYNTKDSWLRGSSAFRSINSNNFKSLWPDRYQTDMIIRLDQS